MCTLHLLIMQLFKFHFREPRGVLHCEILRYNAAWWVLLTSFFLFNTRLDARCTKLVFNKFQLLGSPITRRRTLPRTNFPLRSCVILASANFPTTNSAMLSAHRLFCYSLASFHLEQTRLIAQTVEISRLSRSPRNRRIGNSQLRGCRESIIIIFCHLMEIERGQYLPGGINWTSPDGRVRNRTCTARPKGTSICWIREHTATLLYIHINVSEWGGKIARWIADRRDICIANPRKAF